MKSFPCKNIVIASLLLLIAAGVSFAQQGEPGRIGGTLIDSYGAVIPSGMIMLTSNDERPEIRKPRPKQALSDSSGHYLIEGVPPGEYTLTAEFYGMYYKNPKVAINGSKAMALDITLTYEGRCEDDPDGQNAMPSESEQAWIFNDLLRRTHFTAAPGDPQLPGQGAKIVLLNENITAGWVKPQPGFEVELLDKEEIQKRADAAGDFPYLAFYNLKMRSTCAVVTLSTRWATGKNSQVSYCTSGEAGPSFYRKKEGKWQLGY